MQIEKDEVRRKNSVIHNEMVDDIFRNHRVESAMQDEGPANWQMQQDNRRDQ